MLHYADNQATDNVYCHDQQACDGIATHKFARTVHGAVKICLLSHLFSTAFGLLLADQTGVQVGIDCHLFTGHTVKGKAGTHFCNTPGPLGDDHKVYNYQYDKNDNADGKVAAYQEVAESFDDLARGVSAVMAVHQDNAR